MALTPGKDDGGSVDGSTGEPVKTAPPVEERPPAGTPGDEPFPPEPERGQPASIDRATGEVHGSGSGAGGGNPGEDFDSDAAAGSGDEPEGAARPLSEASQPREDRHEGTSG